MVDEGCWFEGVGGFWVGGGLVVSGSFVGVGAAGDQSGTAAAGGVCRRGQTGQTSWTGWTGWEGQAGDGDGDVDVDARR